MGRPHPLDRIRREAGRAAPAAVVPKGPEAKPQAFEQSPEIGEIRVRALDGALPSAIAESRAEKIER